MREGVRTCQRLICEYFKKCDHEYFARLHGSSHGSEAHGNVIVCDHETGVAVQYLNGALPGLIISPLDLLHASPYVSSSPFFWQNLCKVKAARQGKDFVRETELASI